MRYLLLFVLVFGTSVSIVFAQSDTDDFRISVFGDIDSTPPTTPTLLSATPITPTQIDLAWSTSTDNFMLSGYNILRDGLSIATTTLQTYSDTGLTASTTYSYEVRAFDPAVNYSTTSNSIATTTLDYPSPVATTSASSSAETTGTAAVVVLRKLDIDSDLSSVAITIETANHSRLELRWGRTSSYELGYVVGGIHKKQHTFLITDLEPGTTYEYEIVAYTPYGKANILRAGSFSTESDNLNLMPVNVQFFRAVADGDNVDLSWVFPSVSDIAYVRIVRSHIGFPEHPSAGAVIYQGLGGDVIDYDVLLQYSPVYYTAFVYDKYGNISSGAVAIAWASENQENETTYDDSVTSVPVIDEATTTIDYERLTPEMKMPHASEISIQQGDSEFSLLDVPIYLQVDVPFVVSIPTEAVSGNLKSIIATILNPTDTRESNSYLLRINKDRTAYVATIPAFSVLGRSQIKLEVYDYEVFVVASYQTPLEFIDKPIPVEKTWPISIFYFGGFSVGLLLLVLLVWFFAVRKIS